MKQWTLAAIAATILMGCGDSATQTPSTTSESAKSAETAQPAEVAIKGARLVDEVKQEPGKIVIPYQKYILDNGLTLILTEDHSDPLVHVDVTYHVGSGREEPGKSGFAHFFEHMMFQGSEHVADEQHFKLITEAGGTLNGTTNTDRTNYFETVPSNQLEKMLWLESDRMGYLLNAVTQEKFEVQRETVKNERGQRVDNRPYGRLSELVNAALYPEGHPYSWMTIGYIDDLNRVNVNDLKAFFLRWYGPNNATLTIGGDINPTETVKLAVKYFGKIPRGLEVDMPKKQPAKLDSDRYVSMEDNVHLPLLYMTFPTVYARHKDEAPLDVLASILGGGKSSLLYKNLVKSRFAVQASTNHPCSELACQFSFVALPHPASGKSLADLEKIIRDTLDEFEKRGVEDDDLTKVKASMEARIIFGLQSVRGKVSTLAANETYTHNPNYIEKEVARYANVTKEDVMRVFKQYIKGKSAVIASVVPNGQTAMVAKKDNYMLPERNFTQQSTTSEDDLVMREPKPDFDRSKIPAAGPAPAVEVPALWKASLSNKMKVLGSQSLETPTTSLMIKVPAGHYFESKDKAGLASLTAGMLNESTLGRSGEEMSKALEMLGSSVSINSGDEYITVYINSLTKNLAATVDLTLEKMLQPAFKEDEFQRIKANRLQGIKNSFKDAGYLAATAYRQLLNADSIAALPGNGTLETLAGINLDDVKQFYQTYFKPGRGQIVIVSDLDQKALAPTLNKIENWKGEGPALSIDIKPGNAKKGVIYLVNKDKAAQSAIRIGKRGLKRDISGEFYKSYLANYPLGGAFNSRINLNLREDKGYTYGARSYFWGDKFSGGFTASAEVRADATDKSIIEFVKEIKQYAENGITDEEIAFMRKAINQSEALDYETPRAKLGFLARILEYDLTTDFVKQRSQIVSTISKEEINQLAKKWMQIDEMLMVVVGDSKSLKPKLQKLGYEVIDYQI